MCTPVIESPSEAIKPTICFFSQVGGKHTHSLVLGPHILLSPYHVLAGCNNKIKKMILRENGIIQTLYNGNYPEYKMDFSAIGITGRIMGCTLQETCLVIMFIQKSLVI